MSTTFRTRAWQWLAGLLVLLLVAACASGSSSSPTATSGSGTSPTTASGAPPTSGSQPAKTDPGVTTDKIIVASTNASSGPPAGAIIPIWQAYQAYVRYINDQGGINGRKIELRWDNDNYDPQQVIANTKKYIDAGDVFALVSYINTPGLTAAWPQISEAGLPVVGFTAGDEFWDVKPKPDKAFSGLMNLSENGRIEGQFIAKDLGIANPKVGIIRLNSNAFDNVNKGMQEIFKKNNITPTATETYEQTSVDFSGIVRKVRESGADVLYIGGTVPAPANIIKEVRRQGWNPTIVVTKGVGPAESLLQLAGADAEGIYVGSIGPTLSENTADQQLYVDSLKKVAPDAKPSDFAVTGWTWAKIFVEAIKRMGPNLTRDNLVKMLEGMKDFDAGWGGPISFTADDHSGQHTLFVYQVQNGKLTRKVGPYGLK